ncbi:dual oxidase maturation factor 1 [Elysia marginata]|uniref:Dual oxidase maturation factor 1 n=1 Tax=Elysia marginata TaxID=1093978 RepID=A0AAV4EP04_9GAST|nr:dual oxidase maturation factor 1 [Elysia marginata]
MAAWFKEFRNEHGFTSYPDNETPVTVDIALLAVTYFCVLLSVATLIATLGIRGREKWSAFLRAGYAVAVGSIILVCLVGHGWQQGDVSITSPYVYRTNLPFQGSVGLRVGLHGTNVTLEGYYKGAAGDGYVYYVEEMPWADFGHETERYSYFLQRGLPEPVLKVMEFISIDDGGLRWGRSFHTAGHFAKVLLWTAFAFWLVTNLLLFSVVVYGAYMFFFTGLTMVLACISYHASQLDQPLVISFGDVDLRVSYGWSFWLTLSTGIVTLILGLILIIFDHFAHEGVADFFQLEKLGDEDLFECDDRKVRHPSSSGSISYILDRRGSVVPPPGQDRRGSIFLDPSRRPSRYNEMIMKSLGLAPPPGQVFASSRLGMNGSTSSLSRLDKMTVDCDHTVDNAKTNPLYGVHKTKLSPSNSLTKEDDSCSEMEFVCRKTKVCSSTTKPSLATLREHRDNHANEKIYAETSPCSPTDPKRPRVSDPGLVNSLDMFQGEGGQHHRRISEGSKKLPAEAKSADRRGQQSLDGLEAPSPSDVFLSSTTAFPYTPRSTARTGPDASSSSSSAVEQKRKQPAPEPEEVVVEIFTRQHSRESSSSDNPSASSSSDSGRGASDEKQWESGSGTGSDCYPDDTATTTTQCNTILGSGLGKEVVVNIEASSL